MKKLKYQYLFHGKTITVFLSLIPAFLSPAIVYELTGNSEILSIIIITSLIFATLCIDYAVIHRLKPDEKKKIASAKAPVWEKITPKIRRRLKTNVKDFLKTSAYLLGLELAISVIVLIAGGLETMLVCIAVVIPVTLVILACIGVWEYIWSNMGDSAVYTEIKIDHWYLGERTRGGRRKYIVFYLPDGKYVLECFGIPPESIVVVKYKCFIRWDDSIRYI